MPRRARLVVPGLPHHITQRGSNRRDIFFSDQDRRDYVGRLRKYSALYGVRILGWCLMTNHVHLIAVPAEESSLALMLRETHAHYSQELNQQNDWVGHLWHSRFYSCALCCTRLFRALRYVDLNPVRAGLVPKAEDWVWSSARAHLESSPLDPLLDAGWKQWIVEARLGDWSHADWRGSLHQDGESMDEVSQIRRATRLGEPFGSEEFVSRLERETGRQLRVSECGRPKSKKAEEARAVIAGY